MAVTIIRGRTGFATTSIEHNRMQIHAESTGTLSFTAAYAPREISYEGLAQEWVTADRSGNAPLLLRKGRPLRIQKFSLMLAHPDPFAVQTANIAAITLLCQTRERVLLRYGPNEAGLWRITEATLSSEDRHPDTNEITRAILNLTFTEASDAAPAVGPVAPPPPPPPPPPPVSAPPRTHTVVRTDCLWKIALRYYGNGALWPRIYDANRGQIKNPNLIYPGQVFVIP